MTDRKSRVVPGPSRTGPPVAAPGRVRIIVGDVFGILLSGAVTISEERKVCMGSEKFLNMCDSNEVSSTGPDRTGPDQTGRETLWIRSDSGFLLQLDLTFHLFVCALAGAGAAVIAMVRTNIL